jgi:DNA replication protein DnaC
MQPARTVWQQKWLKLDCYDPSIQALADTVEAFCKRLWLGRTEMSTLVLVGEYGCGKTHCARQIFKWWEAVSSAAPRQTSFSTYVLWPSVVDSFNDRQEGLLYDARQASLMVLDDVGAEHDPFKRSPAKLCQILSGRERKHNVITTNIKPEAWGRVFDGRVADRLMRNSEVVSLFGVKSYAMR